MKKINTYHHLSPFVLESGKKLDQLDIVYHTFGELTANSKVIWVCHALTANSDVSDWWKGLFGEGALFDKPEYFIVCPNIIGSCYGSTGPMSKDKNNRLYLRDFPLITTRDMARTHQILKENLGINEIELLIGSSLGGQQAQEFAYILKNKLRKLILIATNAKHSPFGIAFNEAQRLAILADESFVNQEVDGGKRGLKAARSIAMLSYRSYNSYNQTQAEETNEITDNFKVSSYQNYQGEKLVKRFNAYSYWCLSKAMDSHNIGRNRVSIAKALREITAQTLIVGINSDILFPVEEQKELAEHIPNAELEIIDSIFSHDGFLIETKILEQIIIKFLNNINIIK